MSSTHNMHFCSIYGSEERESIRNSIRPSHERKKQRLEETFAQQQEEMEQLYGNSMVPMPPQSPQAHDLLQIGSTRSSISSYSDGGMGGGGGMA